MGITPKGQGRMASWSISIEPSDDVPDITLRIHGDLSLEDYRSIGRELRKTLGLYNKKAFRSADEYLLRFMLRHAHLQWRDKLQAWNRENPDRVYNSQEALMMAHLSARRRKARLLGAGQNG